MDLKALAYIRSGKTAPAYWNLGLLWMILAEAKDTGGAYSIMEQVMPKSPGPVVHKHEKEDEAFYILEGHAVYTINDEKFEARPGDFLSIPRNAWHSFECLESGTPATSLTLPPDDLTPPDRHMVQRLLDEVGCRLRDPAGPLGRHPQAIRGGHLT
jgi:quercetin dioxygenase-like cupin family protein